MADIAQIGFASDTSGLEQALPALRNLVPAAKAVETAADNAAVALTNTGGAAKVMAAAVGSTTQTTAAAAKVADAAAAANDNQAASLRRLAAIQSTVNKYAGVSLPGDTKGRAEDIAAYGASLDALRAKFNPLFAAGQQYKATLAEINNALKVGAISQNEANEAITDTKIAFTKQVEAIRGTNAQYVAFNSVAKAAAGANDNLAHSHAGLSTQAMAAQHSIRSMVEGLASGMPPSMVLTQQLNHLSYAASGPGGIKQAFSDAIGMFTKFIGAGALVVGGIGAIIIGFGALAVSVTKSLLVLDDLSQRSNFTIAQLHALQQAMSFKGVSADDFTTAINAIAKGVSEASHNMGGLNDLFRANGIQVKDNLSSLMSLADLVAKTADGQQRINLLQAAGLPTTQSFVRFMAQGGAAIKAASANAVQFNNDAETNMIAKAREFDDAWNKATTNLSNYLKAAVTDALPAFDKIGKVVEAINAMRGIYANATSGLYGGGVKQPNFASQAEALAAQKPAVPFAPGSPGANIKGFPGYTPPAAAAADPKTHEQVMKENSDAQARIAILGDLATVQQQVTSKQLELNAAGLQGVGVNDAMAKKILLGVQAQAEMNRVNQQATAGIFNMQSAQKAASDTLQHWIDQGLVDKTNTEQMAAAQLVLARNIKATSDAAAVAAAPLQQLKQLELDSSNFAKVLDTGVTSALNSLVQPIQDVMNGVTSLGQGFKNMGVIVLQAIQQMIIKMLILAPIAKALQATLGGFGGGIGSLFGFSNGGVPGAVGATSLGGAPLVANAKGGVYSSPSLSAFSGQIVKSPTLFKFASGAGLMGEAGPEGILPLKRGPSGALGVQMYGQQASSDNSSSQSVVYAPQNTYHIGGSVSSDDLDKLKQAQADDRANFTGRVMQANRQLNKRNYR
jgi:lambda family phage tail tape measure protein